jgi:hypothetical protein
MLHEVKSWTKWFPAIIAGDRTADIRRDDRGYAIGDTLMLKEWCPIKRIYTGRFAMAGITHIIRNGFTPCAESPHCLSDGFAVLSIKLEHYDEPVGSAVTV